MRVTLKRSLMSIALSLFTIGNLSSFTALTAVLAGVGILSIPQSASATSITGGGYTATGIDYTFVAPSNTWTTIDFGNNTDNGVSSAIGLFDFNFFNTTRNTLYIGTNGILSFGGPGITTGITTGTNVNLNTTAVDPNVPAIAVLWDDWTLQNNNGNQLIGSVRYQTTGNAGSRRFIVQWDNVRRVGVSGNNTATFQAILYEGTNNILLSFSDLNVANNSFDNGVDSTIGIRDTDGNTNVSKRLQWSYNTPLSGYAVGNGKAVCFSPTANSSTGRNCP